MTIEQLELRLLALPPGERARLATRLIESLDPEIDDLEQKAIEAAWKEEVGRRVEAMDRGEMGMIPAESALARVRKRFSL